ncbi:hypothetical protein ACFPRL_23830 [Pseudoclavibacter helvolus]
MASPRTCHPGTSRTSSTANASRVASIQAGNQRGDGERSLPPHCAFPHLSAQYRSHSWAMHPQGSSPHTWTAPVELA